MTDKNQAAKRQPGKALVLGTISGLFTELICYPFDFMKNVIQIEKKFSGRGMRYTANTIYSEYGWKGFYRGLDCQLILGSLRVSFRFGIYEFLRKYVFVEETKTNQFLAGTCTGAVKAVFPICPLELLKIKLISDILNKTGKYTNILQCYRIIVKEKGFFELYKGLTPTIFKISSQVGFRFLWYEQFMR